MVSSKYKQELDELQEMYALILDRAGLKVRIPTKRKLLTFAPVKLTHGNKKCKNSGLSDVKIEEDHFKIYGSQVCRAVSFKTKCFPEEYINLDIDVNFFPYVYDIIVNFQKLNKSNEVRQLKLARNTNRSMRVGLTDVESPERKQYEENAIALIESMMSNRENMFQFELLVIIKEDSEKLMRKAVNRIVTAMNEMQGAVGFPETHANFRLLLFLPWLWPV